MAIINLIKTAIKNPAYKSVATYIFTNFFSKGISLLLIFVFTNPKYLTPAEQWDIKLICKQFNVDGAICFVRYDTICQC